MVPLNQMPVYRTELHPPIPKVFLSCPVKAFLDAEELCLLLHQNFRELLIMLPCGLVAAFK